MSALPDYIDEENIQGTQKWVESRKNYIGGSEAAAIMGYSEYKTAYQLWQQKLGIMPPEATNYAMERGSRLEPVALRYLESKENIEIESQPVLVHPVYNFMRASLDGVTECGRYIVEAKCPMSSKSKNHATSTFGVPLMYQVQIQHALEVARHYYPKLEGCLFISYLENDPESSIIHKVFYDASFVKKMILEESQFWECVQNKTPPLMKESEYENIEIANNNEEWQDIVSMFLKESSIEAQAAEKKAEYRKKMLAMSSGINVKGFGISVCHSKRKGSVQYNKIEGLIGVNLDDYRKDPSIVSTIKLTNDKI